MRKIITSIALITIITAGFTSCKKSNDKVDDETAMLMNKSWKITARTVTPVLFAADLSPCENDNLYNFNAHNVFVFDEGATKCLPSGPQTKTGTWSYNTTTKKLLIQAGDETEITVTELTNNTFKGIYIKNFLGIVLTYSVTFNV